MRKNFEKKKITFWAEIIAGILIVLVVFLYSVYSDLYACEMHLLDSISYIKNECNNEEMLDIASESKSLMRIIESAEVIRDDLSLVPSLSLEDHVERCYLSGAALLDASGMIQESYSVDTEVDLKNILKKVDAASLNDVATFEEKVYSVRIMCEDESYVDLAACSRKEQNGIVVAFYHTKERYVKKFKHSVNTMLKTYNLQRNGIVAIVEGDKIVSSNKENLIDTSVIACTEVETLRKKGKEGALVSTGNHLFHDYGVMEKTRKYVIYAWIPYYQVFSSTIRNIIFTIFVYSFVLFAGYILRWKLVQDYQDKQIKMQDEYLKQLEEKNVDLEKANEAKQEFLSRMSHDMRTPLNGILGLLKIDEMHPDNQNLIMENHEKMKVSANHLLSLITDILQMSKLEDDSIHVTHEYVDLIELSNEISLIIDSQLKEKEIQFEFGTQQLPYPYVFSSPNHLKQIFLNVYGNCIKYNKQGGKIKTELTCLKEEDGFVTYQWVISDTGIGMREEFIEHIFEPFVQEKVDARTKYQGVGLGMAIVKKIIDKLNGEIEVSSLEGVGSSFRILLPFEITTKRNENYENIQPNLSGLHILLAEDNEINAEIAETLLVDKGAVLTIAHNGKEAVELFEKSKEKEYDCILMDVMMPVMTGIEATKRIRNSRRKDAEAVTIIAMTANAYGEDREKCINAGMNAHVSKPFELNDLIRVIRKNLNTLPKKDNVK